MSTTTNTRSASGRIELDVPPERVWKALTDAADLVRWFPLEARIEPGEGGSVFMSWKNEYAGTSKILAWEPNERLAISWSWSDDPDVPPQVTEYRIEGKDGGTVLNVVTSGFPDDPSWDAFVEGTNRGWVFELQSLKQYLEEHDGEDREVVYLRRRIPVSAAAGWERVLGEDGLGTNPLDGSVFDETKPHQYAAVIDDLDGALFRVSVEPSMAGPDAREVVLWLQAWGDDRARLPDYEAKWRPLLERLFPEGETL